MIKIEKSSAPRVVIGKHLTSLIEKNNKIIVIDNDLGTSTSSADVEKTFPKNFLELGIGEQSSLSAATGLALEGMFPVYVNFAIFASGTIWTQIRQAAYAKANLKIIATHPGLDAGPDGASHQATQDMALMRCIPNMNVILPLDENDVKSAISYALNNKGLYYVRVAREPVPAFNFNNLEQLQAIIQASSNLKSPVILQVSKGARKYANPTLLRYMAEGAVEYAKELGCNHPEIVLHLDHGDSFETCKSCVDFGFSSVMIDGSALPYEENIALTKKVVDYAHQFGVTVEGELGVLAVLRLLR